MGFGIPYKTWDICVPSEFKKKEQEKQLLS